MKPLHNSHLPEYDVIQKANDLETIIEISMTNFARSAYKLETFLQRWTETIWYCNLKQKFFSIGTMLFSITLGRMECEYTKDSKGYYLYAGFHSRYEKYCLPDEKIREYIQNLNHLTQLPVNCFRGDNQILGGGW